MDNFYGHDDGGYASLRLLAYLTAKNKTLSEIVSGFPKYISSPEIKVGCPDNIKNEVIERIRKQFIKDYGKENVVTLDGARVNFDDGMMIIRVSQNGPYLTIKFEGMDKETYEKRRKYISQVLKKHPEIDWSFGVNEDIIK